MYMQNRLRITIPSFVFKWSNNLLQVYFSTF